VTRPELLALVQALEEHPELAARVARAVAPHVFAAGAANAKTAGKTYSTRAGQWPPGYSRDAWRGLAKQIGTRRGRYWFVEADVLRAHEQRPPAPTVKSSTWSPAEAADGLRRVSRAAGGGR